MAEKEYNEQLREIELRYQCHRNRGRMIREIAELRKEARWKKLEVVLQED